MCYLPTRRWFVGHLRRSRKHLNTWSAYKTLPRLRTRGLSVPSIMHRKSGFSFTSIPSLRGSLGTPDVVGPRALAEWNRLLPDAVTQQLTCSQGAGASDASSLLEGKAGLGAPGTTRSTKPRPLRPDYRLPRLSELPHVGGASEPRHRLLMNNAGSGGVPDPEVELQSHGSG